MIGFPLRVSAPDTLGAGIATPGHDPSLGGGGAREARLVDPPAGRVSPPRNKPRTTIPGVTTRVVAGVGIGIVPEGFEDQYAELEALVCQTCGGTGTDPKWPRDRYGNETPCPECEDWGH